MFLSERSRRVEQHVFISSETPIEDVRIEHSWNFYLFFLYAGLWVLGYFIWAFRTNRRDKG